MSQNEMKITIITPCIRPANLILIQPFINFKYVREWIIVYDGKHITSMPNTIEKNDKIKEFICKRDDSVVGNAQRNYALDYIAENNIDTYIYFLDDDNIINPDLYNLFEKIEPMKLYTFNQIRPENVFPFKKLLKGDNPEPFNIDTAMILIDFKLCKDIRWINDKYNADGLYIKECYEKNIDKWIYIDEIMAYYNMIT